jgi:hypothetical protein
MTTKSIEEQIVEENHKPCFCDKCLSAYYWHLCEGCKDGHPSFWKTVIESPQWKEWREYNFKDNLLYDFSEVEELGIISKKHFQDFLNFILHSKAEEIRERLEKEKVIEKHDKSCEYQRSGCDCGYDLCVENNSNFRIAQSIVAEVLNNK